ncbi:hypothetical protein FB451DRAFT_1287476 [Mycena latifolia]|nr:hypothetical protein FB451DRAFT_1287476 [Mycena latifolia]
MDICYFPLSWSFAARTSLDSWPPLENVFRAFIGHTSIGSFQPKRTWTTPIHIDLTPTLTSLHDPCPTLRLVATACTITIIGSLVSLAVFLFVWRSVNSPTKAERAILSETAILRIHEMASRQPYPMPPDDGGGDGTLPALPFAQNPRRQSLFIFWIFFLLVAGAATYFLSPFWTIPVSRHIAQQHNKLAWTLALVLSVVFANIADRFCQFAFFLVPPVRSAIQAAIWVAITLFFKPAATAHSASVQVTRMANYLSHWYLGIPLGRPLPERVHRSSTFLSSAVTAVGGYHLVSGRVARNYMLILKLMVQEARRLVHLYFSLQDAPIPTTHFRSWAWWGTKHILTFILGELSWRSISWSRLSILLGPTLTICSYNIYKYNQNIVPPRSHLQLALDPIRHELQRQAVGQADLKRLLQKLDQRLANADLGSKVGAVDSLPQ